MELELGWEFPKEIIYLDSLCLFYRKSVFDFYISYEDKLNFRFSNEHDDCMIHSGNIIDRPGHSGIQLIEFYLNEIPSDITSLIFVIW